jgi:hypothetical protein
MPSKFRLNQRQCWCGLVGESYGCEKISMPINIHNQEVFRSDRVCWKQQHWKPLASYLSKTGPNSRHHYIRYFGTFLAFWDSFKCKNMYKVTHILENVVRCKYFEVGVHITNPIKNSYQDGLGRTTQTLDHVVVVHILIWDKRKSQLNEYSDWHNFTTSLSLYNRILR